MNPPARGRRKASAPPAQRGRRVAPIDDPDNISVPPEEKEPEVGTADAAPAPRKRGPKPGSKRKPREPKADTGEAGGFDFSQISKGLKAQLRELKVQEKAELKAYNAESKELQKELGKLSARMEALEKKHLKLSAGFATGIQKIEATLESLS